MSADLTFLEGQDPVFTLSKSKQLQTAKLEEMKIYNPWRKYERIYVGYNFFSLLESSFGKDWTTSKSLKFIAIDGYIQVVKTKDMLKASINKTGFIAVKEKGRQGFSAFKKGKREVDPGPFYLLWNGFKTDDKVTHGDALKWPFQLKEIHITY